MDKVALTEERRTTANATTSSEQQESIENLHINLQRLENENKELKTSLQEYKAAWNDASERLHFVTSNIKNPSPVYNSFRDKCLKRFIENILMENYELRDVIKNQIHKTDGDVLCQENVELKKKNGEINKLLLDRFKELQALKKQTGSARKDNSNESSIKRCEPQVTSLKQENMKLKTIVMLKNNIMDDIKIQFDKIADNCYNDFKQHASDIDSKELVTEIEKHKNTCQPVMPNFSKEPKKDEVKQLKQDIIDLENKVKHYKGVEQENTDLKQRLNVQIKQFNDQREFLTNLDKSNHQLELELQKLKNEYDTYRLIIHDNFEKLPKELAATLLHQEEAFYPRPPEFHGSKSTPSFPVSTYERVDDYKRSTSDKSEIQLPHEPYQSEPYPWLSTGIPVEVAVRDGQRPSASSRDNVSTNQKEEIKVQGNLKKDNEGLGLGILFLAAESNDLGLFKDTTRATTIDLNDSVNNETILHQAVRYGSIDIIQHLLQTDINIHACGQHQQTILHYAASQSKSEVLKLLLDSMKLDPNTQDEDGKTALHVAVCNQNIDNVALLVKITDTSIIDKKKLTAYNYAYKRKNNEIIKLF